MFDFVTKAVSQRPLATATLAAIGGAWILLGAYNLATIAHTQFMRMSSLERYKAHNNDIASEPWALVTGASDGIGRGFAEEFCNRGFNVVLHGRNEKKLDSVRSDLLTQWPSRKIRLFVFDATGQIPDLERALQQLQELNIKVLVNNVGAASRPFWVPLAQNQAEKIRMPINVDALFTTEITRLLLPKLTKQAPALVINIGSLASEAPCPYVSVLSGVKAYNKAWSRSLHLEMKAERNEVEVIHILVGLVATANEARPVSFMVPSPRQMASSSLNKAGCGQAVVIGYWPHALQYLAMTKLPKWMGERLILAIAREEKDKEEELLKTR